MAKQVYILLGIFQIVSGLALLGIWSKYIYDFASAPSITSALAGHLLISFIIIASGILALLTSNKKMEVLYVISAAVSATVSAAMLWSNATTLGICNNYGGCYSLLYDLPAASLVFSLISLTTSLVGMIMTALSVCNQ